MTTSLGDGARASTARGARGVTVARFASRDDAARAAATLDERGFPVDRLTIVARGAELTERVARHDPWRRAAAGATAGAVAGAAFGWLYGFVNWPQTLGSALAAWGLVIGAVLGAVLTALSDRRRGRGVSASPTSFGAERYELVADAEVADAAKRELGEQATRGE